MSDLDERIRALPKAELHLHLEGAFQWNTVRELHPQGAELPETPPWATRRYADFAEFLAVFYDVLRPATGTPEAVERHTFELITELADHNVRYAEIIVSTEFHRNRGMRQARVLDAVAKGRRRAQSEHDIDIRIIYGLVLHNDISEVRADFESALAVAGPGARDAIEGIDLIGAPSEASTADYASIYKMARAAGLRLKAHAGELGGPDSVRRAIDLLGVDHVAHGVRAAEDPRVLAELARRKIWCHVCPTSNVRLRVAPSYVDHPLRKMLAAGCRVTISTDDPLLFGISLDDEYRLLSSEMGLGIAELAQLAKNGFEASLLDSETIAARCREVDAVLSS
jgi:adenosine deaminase